MSRIGRKPIPVPDGVSVDVAPGRVAVKGPKGELEPGDLAGHEGRAGGRQLVVARPTDRGEHRALHGLTRSLIANMVEGVTDGFEKRLEIQGVGYRAQLKGRRRWSWRSASPTRSRSRRRRGSSSRSRSRPRSSIRGIDKQLVGQVAADIRKRRPPEPYKGKGIRYRGEHVARKVGKRA